MGKVESKEMSRITDVKVMSGILSAMRDQGLVPGYSDDELYKYLDSVAAQHVHSVWGGDFYRLASSRYTKALAHSMVQKVR